MLAIETGIRVSSRASSLLQSSLPGIPAKVDTLTAQRNPLILSDSREVAHQGKFQGVDFGGEGGIRTRVGPLGPHPISSRRRYDRFGTSP